MESRDLEETCSGTGVPCPHEHLSPGCLPVQERPVWRGMLSQRQRQAHGITEAFANQTAIHHLIYLPLHEGFLRVLPAVLLRSS